VYFILENVGVDLSTASDASLIVATYPLMSMLVELVVLRTRMPLLKVTGVLPAAVGAFIVVRNGAKLGGSSRRLPARVPAGGRRPADLAYLRRAAGDPRVVPFREQLVRARERTVQALRSDGAAALLSDRLPDRP
jgi:drug/metabolite transporter (DMT)-like permease